MSLAPDILSQTYPEIRLRLVWGESRAFSACLSKTLLLEGPRYLPLIDRKLRLHAVVPKRGERLLYCDHIDADDEGVFRLACENDLEGIVAKRKSDPYLPEHAGWLKIRNQNYSQWVGHEERFERERRSDPDFQVWDAACNALEA